MQSWSFQQSTAYESHARGQMPLSSCTKRYLGGVLRQGLQQAGHAPMQMTHRALMKTHPGR